MLPPTRPVIIESPRQVAALLKARREQLALPAADLEDALGLRPGELETAEATLAAPRGPYRWFTATALWWAEALGLALVIMDTPTAEAAVAASHDPPITPASAIAYPGRKGGRTPVTRTELRLRITLTG